jgi:hypothetical protein
VRAYQGTTGYQKALRKRSVWVEPLFVEAKDWHGQGRFRLRGLWRVHAEVVPIATGQNLRQLLSKRGWGRRPWPRGAPGLTQVSDRPPRGFSPIPTAPWLPPATRTRRAHYQGLPTH